MSREGARRYGKRIGSKNSEIENIVAAEDDIPPPPLLAQDRLLCALRATYGENGRADIPKELEGVIGRKFIAKRNGL